MEALMFIFIITLFVGVVYLRIKWPMIKGKMGEKGVAMTLALLPKDEYVTLNNVMFKNGSYSTQIDHLVISIYGIFVIETKNYKGWIFGNSNRDYWTQNIWGNRYSLYNPIFQNKNHIKFLTRKFSFIREKEQWIYPIVVFLGASKLQLSGNCECVLWLKELNSYIRSHNQVVMTIDDCRYISTLLREENIEDRDERRAHNNNVQSAIYHHEVSVNKRICPQCGGRLVFRTGKYGNFYGCSNYPKCRYTH